VRCEAVQVGVNALFWPPPIPPPDPPGVKLALQRLGTPSGPRSRSLYRRRSAWCRVAEDAAAEAATKSAATKSATDPPVEPGTGKVAAAPEGTVGAARCARRQRDLDAVRVEARDVRLGAGGTVGWLLAVAAALLDPQPPARSPPPLWPARFLRQRRICQVSRFYPLDQLRTKKPLADETGRTSTPHQPNLETAGTYSLGSRFQLPRALTRANREPERPHSKP